MRNLLTERQAEPKQRVTGTHEAVPDWVPRLADGDYPAYHLPGSGVRAVLGDMPTIVLGRTQKGLAAARTRARVGVMKPSLTAGQAEQHNALYDAKTTVPSIAKTNGCFAPERLPLPRRSA